MTNGNKPYYAYNKTQETFVATSVSRADTYWARLVGLLGKTKKWVRDGAGLWIVPSSGVHTIGMLFPIDVVFLDKNKVVVHLEEHLRPFRLSRVSLKTFSVLELPPHSIYNSKTSVGDQFEIAPLVHASPETPETRTA
jgi:uncharacterized membrane protein (UPF0127 family)